MKKNKKIIIAIIVVAILILVVGIGLAFVLKSNNKEEFFKYVAQIFDSENGFIDKKIENYNQKKASNTFENSGKLTFNVPTEGINVPTGSMDAKTANAINNTFNISFMGNFDNENQKAEELIKINYDNENNFPILYKKVGNKQAIKMSSILKKYLGTDLSENGKIIPGVDFNINDLSSLELTESIRNKLKTDYLQIIKDNLQDKNFTKVTTADSNGYVLEISNQDLQGILNKLVEKLKQDDEILDMFNIPSDSLDLIVNGISLNEGKTIITLYQKDQKVNRIILELDNFIKIDIKKLEQGDELSYDISITESQASLDIIAKAVIGFTGLDSLETVKESYNIGIDLNGESYTYNVENEVNFTDVEIKDFADKEFTDINKLSQANQAKLLQAIMDRFNKINNELMKKAKINPDNFWYNLVPQYYVPETDSNIYDSSLDIEEKDNENEEDDETSQTSDTTDSTETTKKTATDSNSTSTDNDSDENLAKSFSETEKNVFNSKYEKYKGDEVEGSKVKQLIMSIIANNMADEERQIKVTGDITLTGNEVPDSLETSKTYSVEFKKSNDGYVNEAIIKEAE
ncbi:MAG: hypothetical protein J5881_05355 [Clostridia bacterium]|nr:hypothetical protein [Clostridia bacterium]